MVVFQFDFPGGPFSFRFFAGHHLIFAPTNTNEINKEGTENAEEFWLLHKAVDRVLCEPISKDNPQRGGLLALKCKNFLIIIFEIGDLEICRATARTIEALSNISVYPISISM